MIRVAICDENNKTLEKLENLIKIRLEMKYRYQRMIMYFHLLHMYAMRGKENWMRFILILMQGRKEASLQRKACKKNIPILK